MSTVTPIIFEKNGVRVFTGAVATEISEWLIENGCSIRMEPWPFEEYRFAIEPDALAKLREDVEVHKLFSLEDDALHSIFLGTSGPKTTNREFLASKLPSIFDDTEGFEIKSRFGDNDIFFAIYVDDECVWEFEVQIDHRGAPYRRIHNPEWEDEFPWEREKFY